MIACIIPVVRPNRYLREALDSVEAQSVQPAEVSLFLNGISSAQLSECLPDGTPPYASVRTSAPQLPIGASWNQCAEFASSDWVHILHDDDYLFPPAYETLVSHLSKQAQKSDDSQEGILFARAEELYEVTGEKKPTPAFPPAASGIELLIEALFRGVASRCVSTLFRKAAWQKVGGFDETLKQLVDLDFFYRLSVATSALTIDKVIGCYRIHNASTTGFSGRGRNPSVEKGHLASDIKIMAKTYAEQNILHPTILRWMRWMAFAHCRYGIRRRLPHVLLNGMSLLSSLPGGPRWNR